MLLQCYDSTERIEENDLDLDEGCQYLCCACELPIFSTPYEMYRGGRRLHKWCATLPKFLMDHPLHPNISLDLDDHLYFLRRHSCKICGRVCKGFFYHCSSCLFALDIFCAKKVKISHRSHCHNLYPVHRKSVFFCAACESKDEKEFYLCKRCDFFIHRDCASLPNAIVHQKHSLDDGQQHALCLTYNLPRHSLKVPRYSKCSLCLEKLRVDGGAYFCLSCNYATHIKCKISDPVDFQSVSTRETVGGLIHFPLPNEVTSLIQYLQEKRGGRNGSKEEKNATIQMLHEHPLNFLDDYGQESSQSTSYFCNACTYPILPPFYSCFQCSDFYLHSYCANLPLKHRHPEDEDMLLGYFPRLFQDRFRWHGWEGCDHCPRPSNGLFYINHRNGFVLDADCAFLPEVITHEAHGKSHILFLQNKYDAFCHCCGYNLSYKLCYVCSSCPNFELHARCALLPSSVKHKLDRHPLKLTCYPKSRLLASKIHEDFFEICEGATDRGFWFYRCEECDTTFQIDCLPCNSRYSRYQFGETISVDGHDCPLTSIRLITSYSYMCGFCNETIQGRKDGIAFECAKCGF